MKLYQCEKGREYRIEDIRLSGQIAKRLEVLGLIPHTYVWIVNRKNCGTMIIQARGARLAIGRRIGEGIEVAPSRPDSCPKVKKEKKDGGHGR